MINYIQIGHKLLTAAKATKFKKHKKYLYKKKQSALEKTKSYS